MCYVVVTKQSYYRGMYLADKKGAVGYNWIPGGEIWLEDWKESGVRPPETFTGIPVAVCQ